MEVRLRKQGAEVSDVKEADEIVIHVDGVRWVFDTFSTNIRVTKRVVGKDAMASDSIFIITRSHNCIEIT